jgi:hypothetical protein
MSPGELLPILSGLSLGIFLALARPSWRKQTRVFVTLLLALVSCSLSGELRTSWAFLLVDTVLVTLAALVGYVLASKLQWLRNLG